MTGPTEKELLILSAHRASSFLRTLANENRLLILCNLVDAEKSVSELNDLLGLHQPTLSQHLARLRADGFVATRRQGKSIYYSLSNEMVRSVIGVLYDLFCAPDAKAGKPAPGAGRTDGDAVATTALDEQRLAAVSGGESPNPRQARTNRSGRKRETSPASSPRSRVSRRR